MIRVFTDFQAIESDGSCFILTYEDGELAERVQELGLAIGDRVVLDAHEDFEVTGTLDFKFVQALGKETWVAHPDWSTRTEKY